eukprot:gene10762-11730_t
MANKLTTFLLGTTDQHSPLRVLRGNGDVLRMIWIYSCSEWWQLHIQKYNIPHLYNPEDEYYGMDAKDIPPIPDLRDTNLFTRKEYYDSPTTATALRKHNLFTRKMYYDCPLAVVDTNQAFPPLGAMSETGEAISVNMMPFDLFDPEGSLPEYLYGYLPLIENCRRYIKAYVDMQYNTGQKTHNLGWDEEPRERFDHTDISNRIAYLTVDERPVAEAGASHRRGGVHVECPGALRRKEIADKSKYGSDLSWYHPWGLGRAIDEFLVGGIFIASNVSDTTAVWNCRIHDTFGDIIGPHGSLERMRGLLGGPAKRLGAGELVWLSDRTPHESLPMEDASIRRQFFRLVVGEIGFWYADHNTANPTGFEVPMNIPIIRGNKFDLVKKIIPVVWESGNKQEIEVANAECEFRELLYGQGIGFLADELLRNGIYSKEKLREVDDEGDGNVISKIINSLDRRYYSTFTIRFIEAGLRHIIFGY